MLIYTVHELQHMSPAELLKEIEQCVPMAEVIVLAPYPSARLAVDAIQKFSDSENSNNGSNGLPAAPQEPTPADPPMTSLAEDEKAKIRQAIALYGNLEKVAKVLGIGRTTLWRRMKKYGIKRHYSAETPE